MRPLRPEDLTRDERRALRRGLDRLLGPKPARR